MKVKSVNSLAVSDIETAPESSVESEIRKAKKAKVKSVNSLAVSDLETAPESSLESEIRNDSIDLCTEHEKTKESFSDGKKDVNGVTKQNNDSNLSKQPEKTKEASSSKIKGHHQTHDKKRSVKILDLGVNSDCSEPESKSEDKSRQRTDIEPKISVQEIKEKQQVEPESLVQHSSVEQEIEEKQTVEPESLVQQIREEIKEKGDVEPESSVHQVQEQIKEKGDCDIENVMTQHE